MMPGNGPQNYLLMFLDKPRSGGNALGSSSLFC
jgi:hypothetical protein